MRAEAWEEGVDGKEWVYKLVQKLPQEGFRWSTERFRWPGESHF